MAKKVYFAGSIRGGRDDAKLYQAMIAFIKKTDIVLTEQVGDPSLSSKEKGQDEAIYTQDTGWLRSADLLIGEVTHPSLGVGYELAYAERYNKPCYLFYNPKKVSLSAMIMGDKYYHIYAYEKEEDIYPILEKILAA
jgi:nucleoside 2-deoxyribosyltransferase